LPEHDLFRKPVSTQSASKTRVNALMVRVEDARKRAYGASKTRVNALMVRVPSVTRVIDAR
jgi:hypothetical protein